MNCGHSAEEHAAYIRARFTDVERFDMDAAITKIIEEEASDG